MTRIKGLSKLQRKLKQLPVVAKRHIRAELEKVADRIVAMMKSLVPVDDGTLRDSIGWTWGDAPKGAMKIATVAGGELAITIYAGSTEAYYARWVEFGTADHFAGGLFAGARHPGTRSQPFFYVSWRAQKKSAKRAIRKASRDAAKKVAAG